MKLLGFRYHFTDKEINKLTQKQLSKYKVRIIHLITTSVQANLSPNLSSQSSSQVEPLINLKHICFCSLHSWDKEDNAGWSVILQKDLEKQHEK